MEEMLEQVAERGLTDPRWFTLLDAMRPSRPGETGRITLPELFKAFNAGEAEQLILELQDPLLLDAIDEYSKTESDYQALNGLRMLREMAPEKINGQPARLTYLRSAKNITALCRQVESTGLSRNYVRRSIFNGISKVVSFHLGRAERERIFSDVDFARANDARDVYLAPAEIRMLLDACRFEGEHEAYPHSAEMLPIIHLALVTSADRGPLLRLRAKDVELIHEISGSRMYGTVHLRDSKTASRPRSVAITHETCLLLEPFLKGKQPADRVFSITVNQLRHWYTKARENAGLAHVRFKDLRHTFAVHADKAGLSLSDIQSAMGHKDATMSLRYTKYQDVFGQDRAEQLMEQMELRTPQKPKKVVAG